MVTVEIVRRTTIEVTTANESEAIELVKKLYQSGDSSAELETATFLVVPTLYKTTSEQNFKEFCHDNNFVLNKDKTVELNFRRANIGKPIGAGTTVKSGNSESFLIIQLTPNTIGILDMNTSEIVYSSEVTDTKHISRDEFNLFFDGFNYTISDWAIA
jgi:hypothetical protein